MRYDTKVIFVLEKDGYYNPEKGEHIEPTKKETIRFANVTDLGTSRSVVLFGDIQEGAKVIRLLRLYKNYWDYVLIENKNTGEQEKYKSVTKRNLLSKNTFIVKEVVTNG